MCLMIGQCNYKEKDMISSLNLRDNSYTKDLDCKIQINCCAVLYKFKVHEELFVCQIQEKPCNDGIDDLYVEIQAKRSLAFLYYLL